MRNGKNITVLFSFCSVFFSMAILLNSCTIQIQINCGFNDLDVLVKL